MKTKLCSILSIFFLMVFAQGTSFNSFGSDKTTKTKTETNALTTNGNLVTVQVNSPGLENNFFDDDAIRNVKVYLPPGYNKNKESNYPVVYLLPWGQTLYNCWLRMYDDTSLTEILNNLIRWGKIEPIIIVSPDSRNKTGGSWYTNSELAGDWEDFIVKDVVNYIDENFRTLPFAVSRGIAGHSMGGYGALKLATKHPDVFSSVYALNALVDFETLVNDTVIWKNSFDLASNSSSFRTEDNLANQLIQMAAAFAPNKKNPPLYGSFPKSTDGTIDDGIMNKWLEQDPMQMILDYKSNLMQLKAIEIDCSTADANILLSSGYSKALKSNGINHSFNYYYGKDEKGLVKRIQKYALPLFSENLENRLLNGDFHYCYTPSEKIKARLISDGTIYIVPGSTECELNTILSDKLFQVETTANAVQEIPLIEFQKGVYKLIGVSNTGLIGEPCEFGVNTNNDPEIIIHVTSAKSGEILEYCEITVDGILCQTKSNGEYSFRGAGNHVIQISNDKYFTLEKSVNIYTDTTLNYSLVKDSYLQVIEKGTGAPVFEATVTQNNRATLTGQDGRTTVQNLRDGHLYCRIFKPGYITEIVNRPLEPGNTAVVELTPEKANICFEVFDEQGKKIPYVNIKINNTYLTTNDFGEACIDNLDTRTEYSYLVTDGRFEVVENSIFLESNTVVPILLHLINNESALAGVNSESFSETKSNQLYTGMNNFEKSKILLYPNPAKKAITVYSETAPIWLVKLTDLQGRTIYLNEPNKNSHRINLTNCKTGIYIITVKTEKSVFTKKIIKD